MLRTLSIRDVVLIDALDIEADMGLSALTGETGAGKSILLDAMGLALGARGDVDLVRKGATQASVTAVFQLPKKHPVWALLDEQGIGHDGSEIALRRMLGADGRSKAFINDQMAGVNLLRQVGEALVDIHGQFETHGLMDPKTHRGTLDAYAGTDTAAVESAWNEWRGLAAERDDLLARIAEAKRDQEYWQAACDDLAALDPQEGEEEQLMQRRVMLAAREQVAGAFEDARGNLEDEGGAIPQLNRAWKALDRIKAKAGDRLNPATEALDRAAADMRTALDILGSWFDGEGAGPDSLEKIDDRLHALRAQARKHQCRVDDLPKILADISGRLSAIRGDDGKLAKLDQTVGAAEKAYKAAAQKLSDARQKAAKTLDKKVMAELAPLKLDKARFETRIETLPESAWGPAGVDSVQFIVATNPGSAAGPINKIASGGELSRFMLAIKVVLAGTSNVPVLVFDEIDSGAGGATADAIGERLARLAAAERQVLAVTHSPQVAARARHHWIVAKAANDGRTRTTLMRLEDKNRREEIARMISGATVTPEALAAAGKLLQQAS